MLRVKIVRTKNVDKNFSNFRLDIARKHIEVNIQKYRCDRSNEPLMLTYNFLFFFHFLMYLVRK